MKLVRALFVFAVLMLPTTSFAIPVAEVVVLGLNGPIEIPFAISLNPDGKTSTAILDVSLPVLEPLPLVEIDARVDFDPDPFVDYAIGVRNAAATPVTFMFFFSTDFVAGTYSTLLSSHASNVTDGTVADGSVQVVPAGGTFIHRPQINGVETPVGQIGDGCTVTGSPGFSAFCDLGGGSFPIAPVAGPGILGVTVSFTLSPGDSYAATGRVEIFDSSVPGNVPEPSTFILGLGVLAGLLYRQRRR